MSASGGQSLGGQTYNFGSWSDGGAAAHNITVDEDRTLTATFNDVTPPPAPQITDTDPDSPADDDTPAVKGSAGGDAAVVHLYAAAGCTGTRREQRFDRLVHLPRNHRLGALGHDDPDLREVRRRGRK